MVSGKVKKMVEVGLYMIDMDLEDSSGKVKKMVEVGLYMIDMDL
jgi:hypothetical protein